MSRIAALCLVLVASLANAQAPALENEKVYNLWPGQAPLAKGDKPEDTPIVQAFLPASFNAKPTGASFIVCPGGGYGGLADHEKGVVGQWLAKNGVTAFVLRYRLGSKGYHHPAQLTDASRAIRFVRHHSKAWNLDPDRIGILGFSAGGHLASTAATHFDEGKPDAADEIDKASSRPNAQILIYPVITMAPNKKTSGGHDGSRRNLLGKEKADDAALIELLSNEKQVTAKTPPAFIVHGIDDKAVPVSNSDDYAAALKKAGIEVEYIRPENGPHGFGLKDFWTAPAVEWLRKQKF